MTPCARGCCWTPFETCSQRRTCACHWLDQAPRRELRTSDGTRHRDPTARDAIRNVMASRNPKHPRT